MKDLHLFCPDIKESMRSNLNTEWLNNPNKYLMNMEHHLNGEIIESSELTDETLKQLFIDSHRLYLWWD